MSPVVSSTPIEGGCCNQLSKDAMFVATVVILFQFLQEGVGQEGTVAKRVFVLLSAAASALCCWQPEWTILSIKAAICWNSLYCE